MKSISSVENPCACPQSAGVDAVPSDYLRTARSIRAHWLAYGIGYCLFTWYMKTMAQMTMPVRVFDPADLLIGLWMLFFVYVLWIAGCFKKDFGRVYRRARWLGILTAAIFFPVLTLPGILAVRRLERCRRFVGEATAAMLIHAGCMDRWRVRRSRYATLPIRAFPAVGFRAF